MTDQPPPRSRVEVRVNDTSAKVAAQRRRDITSVVIIMVGTVMMTTGLVIVVGLPWTSAILGAVLVVIGVYIGQGD